MIAYALEVIHASTFPWLHMKTMRTVLKIFAVVLAIVVGLPFVLFLTGFINTAPAQDRCSFGSVTNAQYLELLDKAKAQDWTVWPGLSNGIFFPSNRLLTLPVGNHRRQIETQLFDAVRTSISSNNSPDESVAAAHATMRSFGAEYDRTVLLPRVLSTERPRREYIYLEYVLPQRRFAPICLHCFLWSLTNIAVAFERSETGELELRRVNVFHGNFKNTPHRSLEGDCPSAKGG